MNDITTQVLNSQFHSAYKIYGEDNTETWKELPIPVKIGYDGEYCLIRFPNDIPIKSPWKKLNFFLRRKNILENGESICVIGFDYDNLEKITPFLSELINIIAKKEKSKDVQEIIQELLIKWKKYWMEDLATFGKIEQIGLLGELLVLEKLILTVKDKNEKKECLELWKADDDGNNLHDFQGSKGNFEIKTSASVPRKIIVDKFDQFDHLKIKPKSLTLIFVKLDRGDGLTLPLMVNRVKTEVSKLGQSIKFMELIEKRGYRESEIEEYSNVKFSNKYMIQEYLIGPDTPIYTKKDLKNSYSEVFKVIQMIDSDELPFENIENYEHWVKICKRIGLK